MKQTFSTLAFAAVAQALSIQEQHPGLILPGPYVETEAGLAQTSTGAQLENNADFTAWNPELSQKLLFEVHNQLRTDPKSLIPYCKYQLGTYGRDKMGDKTWRASGRIMNSKEGRAAVTEAMNALEKEEVLHALTWDTMIEKATLDHQNDMGPAGTFAHKGNDGSMHSDRIKRYGQWYGTCGENLAAGQRTAVGTIMGLYIDDGVADRGHRYMLMNKKMTLMGITSGPHKGMGSMMTFNYAQQMGPKGSEDPFKTAATAFKDEPVTHNWNDPAGAQSAQDFATSWGRDPATMTFWKTVVHSYWDADFNKHSQTKKFEKKFAY